MKTLQYEYSTHENGIEFDCIAVAVGLDEGTEFTVRKTWRASSLREAADELEEYLNEYHEGYDWQITVSKHEDEPKKSKPKTTYPMAI